MTYRRFRKTSMKLRRSIPGEMDMAQERPASAIALDRLMPCFVLISTNAFLSFVNRSWYRWSARRMLRGFTPLTARGERNFGTQLPAALRLWVSTGHSLLLVPWRIIVPPGWRVRSSSARTADRWSGATYSSTLSEDHIECAVSKGQRSRIGEV